MMEHRHRHLQVRAYNLDVGVVDKETQQPIEGVESINCSVDCYGKQCVTVTIIIKPEDIFCQSRTVESSIAHHLLK